MILYKLGDFDMIKHESVRCELLDAAKEYKIESFLFKFLSKQLTTTTQKHEQLLEITLKEFTDIHQDIFEKQILRIFDFTARFESLLRKVPLSDVLKGRFKSYARPGNKG